MENTANMESIEDSNTSNQSSLPIISHLNRDTFEYQGKTYLSQPTIEELIVEAGIRNIRILRGIIRELQSQGITTIEDIVNINKSQLLQLESGNTQIVNKLFNHLIRVKHRGPLILNSKDMEELEKEYYYLEFEKNIDSVLFKHTNGNHGMRSKSIIELCGDDGVGKTQWCMTAVSSMLEVGRKVVFIDSEGGFDFKRIKQIATENNLSQRSVKNNVILALIDSFDELDYTLDQLSTQMKEHNIGMIVIDSLMQLLQNSYPVDVNLNNLAERQLHLRKTMRRLRLMARLNNLIIIYTNHIREVGYTVTQDIDEDLLNEEEDLKSVIRLLKRIVIAQIPMGGRTLALSSDLRIFLKQIRSADSGSENKYEATLVNCSYLPRVTTEYYIAINGIKASTNLKLKEDTTKNTEQDQSKRHRDNLNDLLG